MSNNYQTLLEYQLAIDEEKRWRIRAKPYDGPDAEYEDEWVMVTESRESNEAWRERAREFTRGKPTVAPQSE